MAFQARSALKSMDVSVCQLTSQVWKSAEHIVRRESDEYAAMAEAMKGTG
jgi:hypothetical protein